MRPRLVLPPALLLAVLAVLACDQGVESGPEDAAGRTDAGRTDAGGTDAGGRLLDARTDADAQSDDQGGATPDSGGDAGLDSGSIPDAGTGGIDAQPIMNDAASADAADRDAAFPTCDPLPLSPGARVRVTPAEANNLPTLVAAAPADTTIVLADGIYRSTASGESARRIQLRTPRVTLRGESGDSSAVVIDGEYLTSEIIFVGASEVTLAHLTVTRAIDHTIHISPLGGADITGVVLYDVRLIDGGEQLLKINSDGAAHYADQGRVECSHFELTSAGRPRIERNPGGCYTGGIDTHSGRGWQVRRNRFRGIYCAGEGLAEHAIHFWNGARDTLVENNEIVDCARGIGFGLVESGDSRSYADDPYPGLGYIGHYDGIIRNNVVYAAIDYFDTGIELAQARGVRVYHNTVVSTRGNAFFSSIDYRFANTLAEIRNNLTDRITLRNSASGTVDHNVESTPLHWLINASAGDFHLGPSASGAIDQGVTVTEAGLDLDGQPHTNAAPDLGADER